MSPADHEHPAEEPLPPEWVQPPAERPVAEAEEEPPSRWARGAQSAVTYFGLADDEPPAAPKPRPTGWRRVWAFVAEWVWLAFFAYLIVENVRDRDYGELIFVTVLFGALLVLGVALRISAARRRTPPDAPPTDDR